MVSSLWHCWNLSMADVTSRISNVCNGYDMEERGICFSNPVFDIIGLAMHVIWWSKENVYLIQSLRTFLYTLWSLWQSVPNLVNISRNLEKSTRKIPRWVLISIAQSPPRVMESDRFGWVYSFLPRMQTLQRVMTRRNWMWRQQLCNVLIYNVVPKLHWCGEEVPTELNGKSTGARNQASLLNDAKPVSNL